MMQTGHNLQAMRGITAFAGLVIAAFVVRNAAVLIGLSALALFALGAG